MFKMTRMYINVTPQDVWREFVFYRKHGKTDLAFEHLRRTASPTRWETLIAGIAYRQYIPRIGDIVVFSGTDLQIVWNEELHQVFDSA